MFCFFKAYQSQTGPFGGLLAPASSFEDYIVTLEDMFVESLPSVVFKVGVGKSMLSQLPLSSLSLNVLNFLLCFFLSFSFEQEYIMP
jgi:hypothetical protein